MYTLVGNNLTTHCPNLQMTLTKSGQIVGILFTAVKFVPKFWQTMGLGNIFGHLLTISSVVTLNMFNVVIVHIFSLTWILRSIELTLFLMIYLQAPSVSTNSSRNLAR
jgi:hypothetical protein